MIYVYCILGILAIAALNSVFLCSKNRKKAFRWLLITAFAYFFLVFLVTLGARKQSNGDAIFIPLYTYYDIMTHAWNYSTKYSVEALIGNVILFIPLGQFLFAVTRRKSRPVFTLAVGALLSLSIELIQLLSSCGTFELDDIIHNTIGAYIGYALADTLQGKRTFPEIIKTFIPFFAFLIALIVSTGFSFLIN